MIIGLQKIYKTKAKKIYFQFIQVHFLLAIQFISINLPNPPKTYNNVKKIKYHQIYTTRIFILLNKHDRFTQSYYRWRCQFILNSWQILIYPNNENIIIRK